MSDYWCFNLRWNYSLRMCFGAARRPAAEGPEYPSAVERHFAWVPAHLRNLHQITLSLWSDSTTEHKIYDFQTWSTYPRLRLQIYQLFVGSVGAYCQQCPRRVHVYPWYFTEWGSSAREILELLHLMSSFHENELGFFQWSSVASSQSQKVMLCFQYYQFLTSKFPPNWNWHWLNC